MDVTAEPGTFWCYVRYGKLRHHGHLETPIPDLRTREEVVIRTLRGTEFGEVVTPPTASRPSKPLGRVLRRPSERDHSARESAVSRGKDELQRCRDLASKVTPPMRVLDVDHLPGDEMIIFYFSSEGRVDFRSLVRELATEYRTRIELRQIQPRDRARLLGDIGHCGLTLCCRSHLLEYAPISMRMARVQRTSLRTQKISGVCGRLLCCLRYEHALYEELGRKVPERFSRVRTPHGDGEVVDCSILTQMLRVRIPPDQYVSVPLSEIQVLGAPARRDRRDRDEPAPHPDRDEPPEDPSPGSDSAG